MPTNIRTRESVSPFVFRLAPNPHPFEASEGLRLGNEVQSITLGRWRHGDLPTCVKKLFRVSADTPRAVRGRWNHLNEIRLYPLSLSCTLAARRVSILLLLLPFKQPGLPPILERQRW